MYNHVDNNIIQVKIEDLFMELIGNQTQSTRGSLLGTLSATARSAWGFAEGTVNVVMHPRETAGRWIVAAGRAVNAFEGILKADLIDANSVCDFYEGFLEIRELPTASGESVLHLDSIRIDSEVFDLKIGEERGAAKVLLKEPQVREVQILSLFAQRKMGDNPKIVEVERQPIQVEGNSSPDFFPRSGENRSPLSVAQSLDSDSVLDTLELLVAPLNGHDRAPSANPEALMGVGASRDDAQLEPSAGSRSSTPLSEIQSELVDDSLSSGNSSGFSIHDISVHETSSDPLRLQVNAAISAEPITDKEPLPVGPVFSQAPSSSVSQLAEESPLRVVESKLDKPSSSKGSQKRESTFKSALGAAYDLKKGWDKGLFLVRLAAWVGTVALAFIPLVGLWATCALIDSLGKRKKVTDVTGELRSKDNEVGEPAAKMLKDKV